jgi:hypothetical protein
MYQELQQYLILYRQLPVPGVGTFVVDRKPADIDFANRVVNPPQFSINFEPREVSISRKLYAWLAASLGVSERDAVIRFNDFSFDLKARVQAGEDLNWAGVGRLSKGLAGEIKFETEVKDMPVGAPVPAVKVIREKAEHTVRVGEDQRSSFEMLERLVPATAKRQPLWAVALIVALAAFVFIAVYFSVNGFSASSASNKAKLTPAADSPSQRTVR